MSIFELSLLSFPNLFFISKGLLDPAFLFNSIEDNQILRTVLLDWLQQARVLIDLVAIAWIVSAANFWIFNGSLNRWGILPRHIGRLWTIPVRPFLHADWKHLEGNSIAFLIYGSLILLSDSPAFWVITWIALLTSGFGIWLFGASKTIYYGASSVNFGYLGFLLARGYFDNNLTSVFLTVLVFFFYGYKLWGVVPLKGRGAWEGHLFGFLGGVLTARYLPIFKDLFQQLGEIFNQIRNFLI
jgi:membrane associated rhomboid family serine protease